MAVRCQAQDNLEGSGYEAGKHPPFSQTAAMLQRWQRIAKLLQPDAVSWWGDLVGPLSDCCWVACLHAGLLGLVH